MKLSRIVFLLATMSVARVAIYAQNQKSPFVPSGQVFIEANPALNDQYPLGPDSLPQPGVPKGTTFAFDMADSKIFPETTRKISVYIPAEYLPSHPACLMVELDSLGLNIQTVLDNLIAQHAMPVTIAVGISPGVIPASVRTDNPRFDRSMEFDPLNGRLAKFIVEEVLPEVTRRGTPTGQAIHISADPNDRGIAGKSTGGIGAFNVAWERPESFHRVFTGIGTFVGMRHGESFYVEVRKTEPKPLRVFMQDSVNDEWPRGPEIGDWWMSNRTMERALSFAGYDVEHVWGTGGHTSAMADAAFPAAMRWLWRGWPAPVTPQPPGNPVLTEILNTTETWKEGAACAVATSLAATATGVVFSAPGQTIGEKRTCGKRESEGALTFALDADGTRYVASAQGGIDVTSATGQTLHLADQKQVVALTVMYNGNVYFLSRAGGSVLQHDGKTELWLIASGKPMRLLDGSLNSARGLAVTPDTAWLVITQERSRFALSYRVLPDGSVDAKENFYDLSVPAWANDSAAGQVAMDAAGRAYIVSAAGIQVMDRNGRVVAILPLPGGLVPTAICFGGTDFATLYVAAGTTVFSRQMQTHGVPPWSAPIVLPTWSAG